MAGGNLALFLSVFLASAVEAVEAVTIVLAAGTARHWKSAFQGVISALLVLAALVVLLGAAISHLPISVLRVSVGWLLLIFGLQWLRKAVLRSSGFKALHDEDGIYQEELNQAKAAKGERRFGVLDWYAFTLSFKGVLLEGLEVVFIVITFGTLQRQIALASLSAFMAVLVATIAGFILAKPLSKVPENTMKYVVGTMLTTFGIFWGAEGSGAHWPDEDFALIGILFFVLIASQIAIRVLRRINKKTQENDFASESDLDNGEVDEVELLQAGSTGFIENLKKFIHFWYDFIIGDDWRVALLLVLAFIITKLASVSLHMDYLIIPLTAVISLYITLRSAVSSSIK